MFYVIVLQIIKKRREQNSYLECIHKGIILIVIYFNLYGKSKTKTIINQTFLAYINNQNPEEIDLTIVIYNNKGKKKSKKGD